MLTLRIKKTTTTERGRPLRPLAQSGTVPVQGPNLQSRSNCLSFSSSASPSASLPVSKATSSHLHLCHQQSFQKKFIAKAENLISTLILHFIDNDVTVVLLGGGGRGWRSLLFLPPPPGLLHYLEGVCDQPVFCRHDVAPTMQVQTHGLL